MSGPPSNLQLPDAAKRGQEISTVQVEEGKVKLACPTCERLVEVQEIIAQNQCPGGHDLDLVLLQGDNAKRGP